MTTTKIETRPTYDQVRKAKSVCRIIVKDDDAEYSTRVSPHRLRGTDMEIEEALASVEAGQSARITMSSLTVRGHYWLLEE